jgi:outer membrane usher protein
MRILVCLLAIMIGVTTRASAETLAPLSAVHYDELLVSVSINGAMLTDNTMVLKDERNVFYAGSDDVTAWHLVQQGRRFIEYRGQRFAALDDCKASLDSNLGRLALTASPSVFDVNVVNYQASQNQQPVLHPKLENGGFVNYDIADRLGSAGSGLSGAFNGAGTVLGGIASASVAQPGDQAGFIRLNTTFERDNVPSSTVLRLGDAVEAGGVAPLQRQFGGLQWGSDFALEPSFNTVSLPQFTGALASDGTLDVIVNGHEISQQQIPAGPFVLQNLPVSSGSGNVTLVLRDASGHVESIMSPYYESPTLLRSGVGQFEFDAGSVRQSYGSISNAYDGTFFSAQGRRGVNERLTLGGAIDGTGQTQSAALAAVYLLPVVGQIAATITERAGLDPGLQQAYTYSYQARRFSLGGQLLTNSAQYRNDGCQLPCTSARYELVGSASISTGRSSSLGLSYGHSVTTQGPASLTSGVSYGRPLLGGHLDVSVLHNGSFPATTTVNATFGRQIGARGYASISTQQSKGQSAQTFSLGESAPDAATGLAYQLQAQTSAAGGGTYTLNTTEQLPRATVNQQIFRGTDTTSVETDVAGSLTFIDGEISAARSIGQGFGVVELPGYPRVNVYANGQNVGSTDSHGRLVLTQLQPFQTNEVTVSASDLPIGVDLVTSAVEIAPFGLSPGIGRFVVKSAGGVSLTLVDAAGAVLPPGTQIASGDGRQRWLTAFDGMAYLEGVAAGKQHLKAATARATCSFEIVVPKDTTRLPDLGRAVCR